MQITVSSGRFLERLELWRRWIAGSATLLVAVQVLVATFIYHASKGLWLVVALEIISFLVAYLCWVWGQTSLNWRSRHAVRANRQPAVVDTRDVWPWLKEVLLFRRFASVPAICVLAAVALYLSSRRVDGWLNAQPRDFVLTLWAMQAALLGLVVVLLTFLFQLITVRLAYETSLLPFLAKRARLKLIVSINTLFVLVNLVAVGHARDTTAPFTSSYVAALSLVFLVVSSLFMLSNVLTWLDPDAVESGITDLIRADILETVEQEATSAEAERILQSVCAANGIEFSPLDVHQELPAIRSMEIGLVADINLARLGGFARSLVGSIPGGSTARRAILVKGMGAAVTMNYDILARVTTPDENRKTADRLRRAFRLRGSAL